jgi:hypothetical protein
LIIQVTGERYHLLEPFEWSPLWVSSCLAG